MSIVRLDLDALEEAGEITAQDRERIESLALPEQRGSLLVNTLMIFGSLAAAAGTIALVPSAITGLILAVIALCGAEALRRFDGGQSWQVLGAALVIMGTAGVCGWIAAETWGKSIFWPPLAITAVLVAGSVWFRSALLSILATLSLGSLLGSGTSDWHDHYGIFINEPTIAIIVFSAAAYGVHKLRGRLEQVWVEFTTAVTRTAFFMFNWSFAVGTFSGDHVGEHWAAHWSQPWEQRQAWRESALYIHEDVFSVVWLVVLAALILKNREGSFVSVASVVFLTIHLYARYFVFFGASARTLLFAGLVSVGLAVAAARWFTSKRADNPAPSTSRHL